jgi:hypothetical protein
MSLKFRIAEMADGRFWVQNTRHSEDDWQFTRWYDTDAKGELSWITQFIVRDTLEEARLWIRGQRIEIETEDKKPRVVKIHDPELTQGAEHD